MSYNIEQFSQITGITKLVLRTWENRYDYLKAPRTKTKIRVYTDKLLVQALNTKLLLQSGHKISEISRKKEKEINILVSEIKNLSNKDSVSEYYVNKFIECAISYNTSLFHQTYDECAEKFSIIELYKKIILPTFSKIGLFWLTKRVDPGQEHFLSELIKQKIYYETERNKINIKKPKSWLLFLPPKEHHEIGLIFAKLLLSQYGHTVIYLGANVPLNALALISKKKVIDNTLFFSISNFSTKNLNQNVMCVENYFPKSKNYLVTSTRDVKFEKIKVINNIDDFIKLICK